MIKDLYYNNIIIYAFAALCGLGVILRFILDIYIHIFGKDRQTRF